MSVPETSNLLPDFLSLTPAAFEAELRGWGWPKFRAKQVRDWVYTKSVLDPALMSNLSKADREALGVRVKFGGSEITADQLSEDGTRKLLLTWPGTAGTNGNVAETVMIPDGPRRTACVSSQVGCPVGCTFCASGVGGMKGNLTSGQIVEQVVRLNQLMAATGEKINHIVFMGMGEPLANYANVMAAIRTLHDPAGLNISARKITLSTVGVPDKMRALAEEELPLNLAISLHAPTEDLRKQLIPWAEHFALPDILRAGKYYFEKTGRELTLEYILLAGVNDRTSHATQLVEIARALRANVNLLRYNEVPGLPHKRPTSNDVMAFQEVLRRGGVNTHVRKSRGRDIDAACGQLRRRENGKLVTLDLSGAQ